MKAKLLKTLRRIFKKDPRFAINAYLFVQESLDVAVKTVLRKHPRKGALPTNVTAADWLDGFREHALAEFGPLAHFVMKEWGVRSTDDVGEIVEHLVKAGVISRQPGDSYEQFKGVFSFEEAFDAPYRVNLA